MEGEYTPETDLTRHHQVLEEGDKFESSFFRLDRCCFLALLKEDTYLLWALWNSLRLPTFGFAFQEENASCFKATASRQDSENREQEDGKENCRRDGMNLCTRRSSFPQKNSQAELMSAVVDRAERS